MKRTLKKITGKVRIHNFLLPVLLAVLAVLTSGSSIIPEQESVKNADLQEKKLTLLEKLEKGGPIASEEIRASFGDRQTEMLPDCTETISHEEIEMMKESIRHHLEMIKHEIGGLKNSDEFVKAMDEVRKGSEEIRIELEKIREEIRRSDRRSGEKENC